MGGGKPLSQSEAKCEAIDMKMSFYSHTNKTHFPQTLGTRNWWRSFQLIWRVSATENSVLASKIDFKAILIVLFVGF